MRVLIPVISIIAVFLLVSCNQTRELKMTGQYYRVHNNGIELELDTDLRGIVYRDFESNTTRCVPVLPAFALVSAGKEIGFRVRKVGIDNTTMFDGNAERYIINAHDDQGLGLSMKIEIFSPEKHGHVLISRVTVANEGESTVSLDTLIAHRYVLQCDSGDVGKDQAPFWAFCGGTYSERYDWIEPMRSGFTRQNEMVSESNSKTDGGNPYTGVWNPQFGLGIMSLETRQAPLSFPVKCETEGLVEICIKEPLRLPLQPGQSRTSSMQAVLVHKGDVYNGLAEWSALLQEKGLVVQESPKSSYDPVWCGWGYEDDYTSEELLATLPVARELGLKWAVVDAGWYDRSTFWELNPVKYPDGDASMRAFTDSARALGMRPKLWFAPATAPYGWPEGRWGKKGALVIPDENMLILDKDGNSIDSKWFGVSYLCPAFQPIITVNRDFVRKAMQIWGFDGFKIDGGYLNQFPLCYNPVHKHDSPLASVYAGPVLLQAMYEQAMSIVPDAVFEVCACGTNFSIYNMQYQNQTVSSDPLNSWQVRHRGKIYHALLGSKVAYYGDHVELSDRGNDFASTIGVGGVPGTKFTRVETRKMEEGSKLLTEKNKKTWQQYIGAYNKERPAEGSYMNLYDIVYDTPETHLIRKGNVLYYGFFTPGEFSGTIELRGLVPGNKYELIDYINDRVLSADTSDMNNEIKVQFKYHLLLKAVPQ